MKQLSLFTLLVLTLIACQTNSQNTRTAVFFNDSFLNNHIKLLDSLNPNIEKKVSFNDSVNTFIPKKINWEKELALLQEANLDKPILATAFNSISIDSAGLKITSHKRKPDGLGNIISAKEITNSNNEPIAFKAIIIDSNTLYISKKHMTINFNNNKLSDYHFIIHHHIPIGFF